MQQIILNAQILLAHAPVQAVLQSLIVSHALTLMVYADIQLVVVILAATHTITVLPVQPVKLVAVAHVLRMYQLDPLASIAQPPTIGVMGREIVRRQQARDA